MKRRLCAMSTVILLILGCSENSKTANVDSSIKEGIQDTQIVASLTRQMSPLTCEASDGLSPYCGFKNPEDIVVSPDGEQLVISEMGEFMQDSPGKLVLFDLATSTRVELDVQWESDEERWGETTCPQPNIAAFSPHGIDLIKRTDGRFQLLVVNHGGREAVEFFELHMPDETWLARWKGCALPPEDPFINDVAGLNDGGFVVTQMWNKQTPFEEVAAKLIAGEKIGWVWHWDPATGFSRVPDSEEMMPNGIAVSRDNQFLFVNIYMGNKTIKLNRITGEKLGEFEVRRPDNVPLDQEGNLWVASHLHDPIQQTCTEIASGPCLLPFQIIKADSVTMKAEVFLQHDGAPMGYTTVAVSVGDSVFMGSAHGDRIVSVRR